MEVVNVQASAVDKFVASLTTLDRRFSVQLDAGGTALLTWILTLDAAKQAEFLAHFWVQPWMIPPALFIVRSVLVATPQPKVLIDTAVKAEVRAEAKKADTAPAPL
jgi:hypothetical protein